MNDKLLNPNAFPETDQVYEKGEQVKKLYPGMTLRDYFAAKAMQAIISKHGIIDNVESYHQAKVNQTTRVSYELADKMLKQREQNP